MCLGGRGCMTSMGVNHEQREKASFVGRLSLSLTPIVPSLLLGSHFFICSESSESLFSAVAQCFVIISYGLHGECSSLVTSALLLPPPSPPLLLLWSPCHHGLYNSSLLPCHSPLPCFLHYLHHEDYHCHFHYHHHHHQYQHYHQHCHLHDHITTP